MKTFVISLSRCFFGTAVSGSRTIANRLFAGNHIRLFLSFTRHFPHLKHLCIIALMLICGVGSMWGATVTFDFTSAAGCTALGITRPSSSSSYTNLNAATNYTISPITMNITHGGTTNTRVYNASGNTTLRTYHNVANGPSTIRISCTAAYAITKIVFTASTFNFTADVGTYNSTTKTWEGNTSSVTFTSTASSNTISSFVVTYETAAPRIVTLMDDGTTRTEASVGAGVTLPSRTGCTGYTFAGWTASWTEEQDEWTTTPPTIISAGSYTPPSNQNLYPVYTKTESATEGYYITTTLEVGKTYIFGAVKAAASATLANNVTFGAVAFAQTYTSTTTTWGARVDLTPNTSGYVGTASVTAACRWVLQSITDGKYVFKKGSDYLYIGDKVGNTTNGAQCGLNTSGSLYLENVNSTCKNAFLCHPTSSSTNVMLYNTGSSGYRMYASRTYSNTMTPYVRFYEYVPPIQTYYISEENCCTSPSLSFASSSVNKTLGTDGDFTITASKAPASTQTISYSSSDISKATVNSSTGLVHLVNSGDVVITASVEKNATHCAATASYTIHITAPNYTVEWLVNGDDWSEGVVTGNSSVSSGAKIASMPIPPSISDCYDTKEFVGWTATPIVGSTNTRPADLFTTVVGSPTINANTTFHAVFATRAAGDMPRSVSTYSAGDYYLIDTYDGHYYALTGSLDESVVQSVDVTDYVTESAGVITLDVHGITPQMRYTLSGSQGTAKLVNTLSGSYIACASSVSFSSSSTNTWNIAKHGSRNAFSFVGGSSGTDRCILFRNGYDFRNYETSNRGGSGYGTGYMYLVATRDDVTFTQYATTCVENKQVSWVVGGEPWTAGVNAGNTNVEPGSKVATVPTAPTSSDCDGLKYFMGWTNEENYSDANFAPAMLFTNVAGSPTITQDTVFYAVFSDVEADVYRKVTSTAGITDGDYLIVYETGKVAFNGGLTTLDAASNTIDVTITSSTIPANATTNAARFVINKTAGTIKSVSGYYIGRTTDSNGFNSSTSTIYTNTMSISSNNFVVTSSAGPLLRYNNTSGQLRFRYYASGQQPIQLYKKTVPNYTTVCALRTITWHVNDGTTTAGSPTTEVSDGGYVTKLPTTPDGAEVCGGKTFVGWTTAPYTNATTPPAILYNSAAEIPAIVADVDFYAVFAEGTPGEGDGHYYKVTDNLDVWTGKYLIVNEGSGVAFDGSLATLDATSNKAAVTISAGKILGTSAVDAISFTIDGDDDAVTIKSASGYYIYWGSSKSNGLNQSAKANTNTLSISAGNAVITGTGGYILRYNNSSGQLRFRYFASGQQAIQLYRKNGTGTVYTKYSTSCGPRIAIGEPELLTSTRSQSVQSAEITVEGSDLTGSTLTPSITGGGAASFSCTIASTTVTAGVASTTYHITYTPTAYAAEHYATLTIGDGTTNSEPVTLHGRSLPQQFAIVAEVEGSYYALNGNMGGTAQRPAGIPVSVSEGTIASCPQSAVFSLYQREPVSRYVYLTGQGGRLWGSSSNTQLNTKTGNAVSQTGWLLQTDNLNTYHITNAQVDRGVMYRIEEGVFGHYADGNFNVMGYNGELHIVSIGAICTSLEAPAVTVAPKATRAILTWNAIEGAVSYAVTCSAGSVTVEGTTATITGLANNTQYTYTVKAVAAGTDCSLITSGTFNTSDCDDVPILGEVVPSVTSATFKWTCEAPTSTITLYNNEACTIVAKTVTDQTSPATVTDLLSQHTYWYKISAGGTCVSNAGTFNTLEPTMDIIEWDPEAVIIDYSGSDEGLRVIIDKEITVGDEANLAEELFFSKYFEASSSNKFLAIFNGTASEIDLTKYKIGMVTGVSAGGVSTINYYGLDTLGRTKKGKIMPHEEIVLVTYDNTYSAKPCAQEVAADYNKWYEFPVGTTFMQFAGPQSIGLYKYDEDDDEWYMIDVIGSSTASDGTGTLIKIAGNASDPCASAKHATLNDAGGFYATNGDNIRTEAVETTYRLSTNRCLLIRKSTVKSGANAVTNNVYATTNECSTGIATSFTTLASEWAGYQISNVSAEIGRDSTCKALGYIGAFDYANFYHTFENIHDADLFSAYAKDNGTHVVPVDDLDQLSCSNIKVQLVNGSNENVMTKYYQVPIMIDEPNTLTTNTTFRSHLRNAEVCKTCKVVVMRGASLVKAADDAANDIAEIGSLEIYQSSGLSIPAGTNYKVKDLHLRAVNDNKDSLPHITVKGNLNIADNIIYMDRQLDDNTYYWVSFPYDAELSDITYYDGSEAVAGSNFYLKSYNGSQRAEDINSTGSYTRSSYWEMVRQGTVNAGQGYILAIPDEPNHKHRRTLSFPMNLTDALAETENDDKTIPATDAPVSNVNRQYDAGWNCIGNPYMQKYTATNDAALLEGKWQKKLVGGTWFGEWEFEPGTTTVPYITLYSGGDYVQSVIGGQTLQPFTSFFVQVGADNTTGLSLDNSRQVAWFAPAREKQSSASRLYAGITLTNDRTGATDDASVLIGNEYNTTEYIIGADLQKMKGNNQVHVYTTGKGGELAFQALTEETAAQAVPLGYRTLAAGEHTFELNADYDISRIEGVYIYDTQEKIETNLLYSDYTFTAKREENRNRFTMRIALRNNIATDCESLIFNNLSIYSGSNTLTISGLPKDATLYLYDMAGRLIEQQQPKTAATVINTPQAGVYNLRITTPTQSETIKVIAH